MCAYRDMDWHRMVLEGPLFQEYFKKVEVSNFEVASDAFQTFKDLLTRHEPLVASYLQSHYQDVSALCLLQLKSNDTKGIVDQITLLRGCAANIA
jgi:hypothetical protein